MTKLAVTLRKAAGMLLEAGLSFDEANAQLNNFHQPSEGYIYLEDVVKATENK